MVAFFKTASCSIIIAGSLLASLWASQIGRADALERNQNEVPSPSFTVSVPHTAAASSSSIIEDKAKQRENDIPDTDYYEEDYEWENENELSNDEFSLEGGREPMETSDSNNMVPRRRTKKQKNKGPRNRKRDRSRQQDPDPTTTTTGESRTVLLDERLEECIQGVLDIPTATRSHFTNFTNSTATRSSASDNNEEGTDIDDEQIVLIRHRHRRLLEESEPDDFLLFSSDDISNLTRDMSTCDQVVTDQMQEMVSFVSMIEGTKRNLIRRDVCKCQVLILCIVLYTYIHTYTRFHSTPVLRNSLT